MNAVLVLSLCASAVRCSRAADRHRPVLWDVLRGADAEESGQRAVRAVQGADKVVTDSEVVCAVCVLLSDR